MPTRKEFLRSFVALALAGFNLTRLFAGRGRAALAQEAQKGTEGRKKMIAKCGLNCAECPAYIATQKNDDALRAETAKKWSEMFKSELKPADINCDGCQTDSPRLLGYCSVCEIRKCAREKKLATCAACPEYSCGKLDAFLAQVPEARRTLEALRKVTK
jgi:hypothetical protein